MSVIAFTGTRSGMTQLQMKRVMELLLQHRPTEVHHGACEGADREFHNMVFQLDNLVPIHLYPAFLPQQDWALAASGNTAVHRDWIGSSLLRNHHMVDVASLLIATPNTSQEVLRSGTWATIRHARKAQDAYIIVFPDGTEEKAGVE